MLTCGCRLINGLGAAQHPSPPPDPKKDKNAGTHLRPPMLHHTRTCGPSAGGTGTDGRCALHLPSSRLRCPKSARRPSAPRARRAGQPRCSRTECRPCASAATTGTPTGSPTCRRGPLQPTSERKLSFPVLGPVLQVKHSVRTKLPATSLPIAA